MTRYIARRGLTVGALVASAAACSSAPPATSPMVPDSTVATSAMVIDATQRHQTIAGYGTALVTWSPTMTSMYRGDSFQRIYTQQLGFNFLRLSLWGPTLPKPVADWRDISHRQFDRTIPRFEMYFDLIRGLKRYQPDLKLIGTVWSPPPWMKANDALEDVASAALRDPTQYVLADGSPAMNRLRPEYVPHYVQWLVEMAKLFRDEGMPLHAISVANEPMFTQRFESAVWTARDLATVAGLLGQRLEAEGLDVKVFGPETMTGGYWTTSNRVYVDAILRDSLANRYVRAFATHGYTDGFSGDVSQNSSSQFWSLVQNAGRPFWMTEGGTGGHRWPEPLTNGVASAIHNAFVYGNASAFVPWQVSDEQENEHGLMVVDQLTKKTQTLRQYSLYVRPGAVRIGATPADGAVKSSAYLHAVDGTLTVVLVNPNTAARRIEVTLRAVTDISVLGAYRTSRLENVAEVEPVQVNGGAFTVTLSGESIVTLYGPARAAPN